MWTRAAHVRQSWPMAPYLAGGLSTECARTAFLKSRKLPSMVRSPSARSVSSTSVMMDMNVLTFDAEKLFSRANLAE